MAIRPTSYAEQMALDENLRAAVQRLERELRTLREEPIRRVSLRAMTLRPLRVRQFHRFGSRSFIDRPTWLYGTDHIDIGAGVMFLRGAWLAAERVAWDRPEPVMTIGDRVGARPGCTISAGLAVVVEDDVLMGTNVTIIDSKHTWSAGNPNALYNPSEFAPVRVGKGTWLADRVTVASGAEIGEQCAIGSNTTVGGRIPDYSIAIGNPARVVGSTRV